MPHRRPFAVRHLLVLVHQAQELRVKLSAVLVAAIGRDPSQHVRANPHDIMDLGTVEDLIEGVEPGAKLGFGLFVFLGCGNEFRHQAARRLR